jgi:chromosome segregation protein
LSQVGVVETEAEGRAIMGRLAQGQRLVTRDGAMWRWDGFSIAAGTPTAAERRLRQRRRLAELGGELAAAEAAHALAESRFGEARRVAEAAADSERRWRESLQAAYRSADDARTAQEAATQTASAAAARRAALAQLAASLAGDIAEAEAQFEAAQRDEKALPDLAPDHEAVDRLRTDLVQRRADLAQRRSEHDRLLRDVEARTRRLSVIAAEGRSWSERAAAAASHLAILADRQGTLEAEGEALARRPAEIAERRRALLDLIGEATTKRRRAADDLAAAETRLADADRELKAAGARLAEGRENRIRADAASLQAREAGDALAQRIRERIGCAPEETGTVAGLAPDALLPDRATTEARLERLLREREGMGPVNLRAESEASELEQQIVGLQSERSDLVSAIARLRTGIASLDREGRERLLAAFELVDRHFRALFTRLFGGGHAHLKLTDSDDPLDAGLEIMASPPGKRLQTMSLLSGGEQALAALSVLFAVFLTNPAPICVLDEVDAPLDDANVDRFCSLVEELAHDSATRFLVITHHRMTMARMDRLFGVTMAERGVSQLVSVDLQEATLLRAAE